MSKGKSKKVRRDFSLPFFDVFFFLNSKKKKEKM